MQDSLEAFIPIAVVNGEKQIVAYCEGYEVYSYIPYTPFNAVHNYYSIELDTNCRNAILTDMTEYFENVEWEKVKINVTLESLE